MQGVSEDQNNKGPNHGSPPRKTPAWVQKRAHDTGPGCWGAESGAGVLMLDDLEKIARVLGVKVAELFISPGRTAAERLVLALLEEGGE